MAEVENRVFGGPLALAWSLAIGWTGVVLWAGSGLGSEAMTSRFIRPLLEWLLPRALPETLTSLHWGIRKGAHLAEYGLLAVLAARALASTRRLAARRLALAALAWVAVVASFDEARQAFTDTRSGSPGDIALDVAGGMIGLAAAGGALRHPPGGSSKGGEVG
ncbi:MAG: VanZ family protein [Myxococcota bacterium]